MNAIISTTILSRRRAVFQAAFWQALRYAFSAMAA